MVSAEKAVLKAIATLARELLNVQMKIPQGAKLILGYYTSTVGEAAN
jgi:hypothetical protein